MCGLVGCFPVFALLVLLGSSVTEFFDLVAFLGGDLR